MSSCAGARSRAPPSPDPATVCALHLGMAKGLTEDLEGAEVLELVARDPRVADCTLRIALHPR